MEHIKDQVSRRAFLKTSLTLGGGLAIGLNLDSYSQDVQESSFAAHVLVTVFPDNTFEIKSKNPEIGQGIKIALPLIIAEEMDVAWKDVRIVQAEVDKKYGNQFAGGSLGVRLNWEEMRKAGAMIRLMFRQAAAKHWDTSLDQCSTSEGLITNLMNGQTKTYGSLISVAKDIPIPTEFAFKKSEEYKIVGNINIGANANVREIVSGLTLYSSDMKWDDMLYASIERAPFFDGQVESVDGSEALKIPGVKRICILNNESYGGRLLQPDSPNFVSGVAVLASNTWAAFQGRKVLKIKWSGTPEEENSESLQQLFNSKIKEDGEYLRKDGPPLSGEVFDIESTYFAPFLAHVPMEPMNCSAYFNGGECELWAPTQNPAYVKQGVAKVLGITENQVKVNLIRAGGAFGRRYYADFTIDAALLSKVSGTPVKVMWTREDDIHYDYFRPSNVHRIGAKIDAVTNEVTAWKHKQAGTSRNSYLGGEGPAYDSEMDNYNFPAGFVSNLEFEFVSVPSKVPLGQWRGVADSVNLFVSLSFIDEVAHKLKKDSIEHFLDFLGKENEVQVLKNFKLNVERLRNIVNLVRTKSGWTNLRKKNRGYGFAAGYTQGSFVALVAEVEVLEMKVKVLNITVVVDCGLVINPSGAQAQVEGSVVEGLSSSLFGKVDIANSFVKQSNFHEYRWIRMKEIPVINIHFLPGIATPRGLGEPVLPMVAPAVCNAIFNACGKRICRLPVIDNGFEIT